MHFMFTVLLNPEHTVFIKYSVLCAVEYRVIEQGGD